MARNLSQTPSLNKSPAALGFICDVAHAPEIRADLTAMLPGCTPARQSFSVWQNSSVGILILVVTLDAATPIQMYVADGPRSLRRQLARAVRALHGKRTAWVRGLSDEYFEITDSVFAETCERRWTTETLAGAAVEGNA
jgi:hypothetical protein